MRPPAAQVGKSKGPTIIGFRAHIGILALKPHFFGSLDP